MKLLLIRHGESNHSIERRISGPASCTGLTQRGFQQAELLADRLIQTGEAGDCAVLLSSPVLRAVQTAQVISKALPGIAHQTDINLCELLPGEADGLKGEEYVAKYGSFDLMEQPDRPFSPGGESWNTFNTRVQAAMDNLASRYDGQTVVAATHAGFIVISFLLMFGITGSGRQASIDPVNTGITEWEHKQGRWRLIRYNDASHLAG